MRMMMKKRQHDPRIITVKRKSHKENNYDQFKVHTSNITAFSMTITFYANSKEHYSTT